MIINQEQDFFNEAINIIIFKIPQLTLGKDVIQSFAYFFCKLSEILVILKNLSSDGNLFICTINFGAYIISQILLKCA